MIRLAPRFSKTRAVSARKGCASRNTVPAPTAGNSLARAGRQKKDRADPDVVEQAPELIFHDIGQGADDEQRPPGIRGF